MLHILICEMQGLVGHVTFLDCNFLGERSDPPSRISHWCWYNW